MGKIFAVSLVLLSAGLAGAAEPSAKLTGFANSVLLRHAGSSEWGKAVVNMDLYRHDTLYTMAASRAQVRFNSGETLELTANTLVVLRPPLGGGAAAQMLSGELRSARSRVVTRSAVIRPKSPDAEFDASIKPDFTTVVSVTRGEAEVEAQGKKVSVRQGYSTAVRLNMAPEAPKAVPGLAQAAPPPPPAAAPAAVAAPAPAAEEASPDAVLPPDALASVQVLWGYRVQVARDRAFAEVVLDRKFELSEKPRLGELLPPGRYYVRTARIDLLEYESKFGAPRPVTVK